MRQLFDPSFGMFQLTEGRVYWFRASSLELAMEFELVGTLLGLAIFNNHILDLAFPTLVYQCVPGCCAHLRRDRGFWCICCRRWQA